MSTEKHIRITPGNPRARDNREDPQKDNTETYDGTRSVFLANIGLDVKKYVYGVAFLHKQ